MSNAIKGDRNRIAEAHPQNGKSLYSEWPVKGEIALKENEPGVFYCLQTGEPVIGSRGISQENVSIQQNVTPIKNSQMQTIAALIMETDITDMVEQEKAGRSADGDYRATGRNLISAGDDRKQNTCAHP